MFTKETGFKQKSKKKKVNSNGNDSLMQVDFQIQSPQTDFDQRFYMLRKEQKAIHYRLYY